jgi:hypothetical protein
MRHFTEGPKPAPSHGERDRRRRHQAQRHHGSGERREMLDEFVVFRPVLRHLNHVKLRSDRVRHCNKGKQAAGGARILWSKFR